ncbi:MAG: DNA-binding response regulator [Bacteroidota bacterium]
MHKRLNTLIAEDEQLLIDPMVAALELISETNSFVDFNITSVLDCDGASEEIQRGVTSEPLDLILLDMNLKPSSDGRYLSGEDLGLEIRNFFPKAKIVAITHHNNNYMLNSILKSLDPDGFLIKSDMNFAKLIDALKMVIDDTPYYSKVILKLMRRHMSNEFTIDRTDRLLLHELSKGAKTKHLCDIIPLSTSAIELRKRNLKRLFKIKDGDDRKLIAKAQEFGFI